ncbi:hypothetical protein VTL71DRAFT_1000 [Oculimacula yallundae]|uniref:Uncharacterized protein n=1 Tax=Oculimacula yallundae TaxID=86028 RepID=A0ABR4D1Q0_9HELO
MSLPLPCSPFLATHAEQLAHWAIPRPKAINHPSTSPGYPVQLSTISPPSLGAQSSHYVTTSPYFSSNM